MMDACACIQPDSIVVKFKTFRIKLKKVQKSSRKIKFVKVQRQL